MINFKFAKDIIDVRNSVMTVVYLPQDDRVRPFVYRNMRIPRNITEQFINGELSPEEFSEKLDKIVISHSLSVIKDWEWEILLEDKEIEIPDTIFGTASVSKIITKEDIDTSINIKEPIENEIGVI